MRVRLTRRLAERVNGVDLSRRRVGDVMDLSRRDAAMTEIAQRIYGVSRGDGVHADQGAASKKGDAGKSSGAAQAGTLTPEEDAEMDEFERGRSRRLACRQPSRPGRCTHPQPRLAIGKGKLARPADFVGRAPSTLVGDES